MSKSNQHPVGGKSLSQQQFGKSTDINKIVHDLQKGIQPQVNQKQPRYMTVPSLTYQEMMQKIIVADNHFASLPPSIKNRFRGSAFNLIKYLEDPANQEEALKLGLIEEIPQENTKEPQKTSETPPKA